MADQSGERNGTTMAHQKQGRRFRSRTHTKTLSDLDFTNNFGTQRGERKQVSNSGFRIFHSEAQPQQKQPYQYATLPKQSEGRKMLNGRHAERPRLMSDIAFQQANGEENQQTNGEQFLSKQQAASSTQASSRVCSMPLVVASHAPVTESFRQRAIVSDEVTQASEAQSAIRQRSMQRCQQPANNRRKQRHRTDSGQRSETSTVGDISAMDAYGTEDCVALDCVREGSKWPDATLVYTFSEGIDTRMELLVMEAMKEWSRRCPVHFRPKLSGDLSYVEYQLGQSPLSSGVGMTGKKQTIVLSPNCKLGIALHEIGHALGLYHTHARSDRDRYIKVNEQNAEKAAEQNLRLRNKEASDIGLYDFSSVMHYKMDAFSPTGSKNVIVPLGGAHIGQRRYLSLGDVKGVTYKYGSDLTVIPALSAASLRSYGVLTLEACGMLKNGNILILRWDCNTKRFQKTMIEKGCWENGPAMGNNSPVTMVITDNGGREFYAYDRDGFLVALRVARSGSGLMYIPTQVQQSTESAFVGAPAATTHNSTDKSSIFCCNVDGVVRHFYNDSEEALPGLPHNSGGFSGFSITAVAGYFRIESHLYAIGANKHIYHLCWRSPEESRIERSSSRQSFRDRFGQAVHTVWNMATNSRSSVASSERSEISQPVSPDSSPQWRSLGKPPAELRCGAFIGGLSACRCEREWNDIFGVAENGNLLHLRHEVKTDNVQWLTYRPTTPIAGPAIAATAWERGVCALLAMASNGHVIVGKAEIASKQVWWQDIGMACAPKVVVTETYV